MLIVLHCLNLKQQIDLSLYDLISITFLMNSLLDLYVQDVLSIVALSVRIEDRSFDDLREIVFDFDVFLTFEPSVEPDEEFGGEMKILDETIS